VKIGKSFSPSVGITSVFGLILTVFMILFTFFFAKKLDFYWYGYLVIFNFVMVMLCSNVFLYYGSKAKELNRMFEYFSNASNINELVNCTDGLTTVNNCEIAKFIDVHSTFMNKLTRSWLVFAILIFVFISVHKIRAINANYR